MVRVSEPDQLENNAAQGKNITLLSVALVFPNFWGEVERGPYVGTGEALPLHDFRNIEIP